MGFPSPSAPSPHVVTLVFLFLSVCFLLLSPTECVDRHKFRQCNDSPFCRRHRPPLNGNPNEAFLYESPQFDVIPSTVEWDVSSSTLRASLSNIVYGKQRPLQLNVTPMDFGGLRITIDELSKEPYQPRWRVRDVIVDSGETAVAASKVTFRPSACGGTLEWSSTSAKVSCAPFAIVVSEGGKAVATFNAKNLFNMEQYRGKNPRPAIEAPPAPPAEGSAEPPVGEEQKPTEPPPPPPPAAPILSNSELEYPYDVDGMWSFTFGGNTDEISRGPSAVSGDIRFHSSDSLYGLPEHASSFALKSTRYQQGGDYGEPYRLFNLDVFEYELDNPMALYGAVPLIISHGKEGTFAALWLNAAETYVDIYSHNADGSRDTHWISESGIVEVYILVGPTPYAVFEQYGKLTGNAELPQRFSLGYHQCRWNYKSEEDVAAVDAGFDEHDIPYDTMWLDIEHTDGKKYFTWDKTNFPHPDEMQKKLSAKGRRMVTIVDPHIKREGGYVVHSEADSANYYVKNAQKGNYEGWCWPGSVSYLDFLLPNVRDFWAKLFSYSKYSFSTPSLFTWNDMNEPSVFNGPEVTMPKENLHLLGTVPHRDVHNVYGFYNQMATHQGLVTRDEGITEPKRSFVLSRSFFAGSQRYGAVWTGDNRADWAHLKAAQPMLLSMGVAGITFSGSDIGGFFGDPSADLLTRWYQAAAFHPFMRGHAHIDAKRREPWLFGTETTAPIRAAIKLRYSLMPYLYSTFYSSSTIGVPVMRPLWSEFPADEKVFKEENVFMLGDAIIVFPIVQSGVSSLDCYLPGTSTDYWYSMLDGIRYMGGAIHSIQSPLQIGIPHFQRGGTIVPQKWRARRSSDLMEKDPFTLVIALNNTVGAEGFVYEDDGQTFRYTNGANGGEYSLVKFSLANGVLSGRPIHSGYPLPTIERIVIWGSSPFSKATLVDASHGNVPLVTVRDQWGRFSIRNPRLDGAKEFKIILE